VAGAADSTGLREAGGTGAAVPDAGAPDAGGAGGDGAAGRGGAEGWLGAGADGTWIESSRHSQTPRAASSRCGVNAAGASGASAGREADAAADAWPAGLAHGGSLTGR